MNGCPTGTTARRRAAAAVAWVVLFSACPAKPAPPPPEPSVVTPTFDQIRQDGWTRVEPGGRTLCARGDPFAYFVHRGDPSRLLVFFTGGGACQDGATCRPGSRFFRDTVRYGPDGPPANGILDFGDPRNPFRDYTAVVIPECTGDLHWGDRDVAYVSPLGGSFTIYHRGWVNARSALRWASTNVPSPAEVFVAGCSAGSIGSAAHAPFVARRYPEARVTQLGDSFAGVFPKPIDLDAPYGAGRHLATWLAPVRDLDPKRLTMTDYYRALVRAIPDQTFSEFSHDNDLAQKLYFLLLGGFPRQFSRALRVSFDAIETAGPNFSSYIAAGNGHCVLQTPSFYSEGSRVPILDWVTALASDGQAPTVRP
ncbi:MAG TPA: pectin acetylesterase-family hydrolase [Actinomycetota bacterium]|nr:pectin acetylesterase-family hydrolase [Actinomycetota bacterium]